MRTYVHHEMFTEHKMQYNAKEVLVLARTPEDSEPYLVVPGYVLAWKTAKLQGLATSEVRPIPPGEQKDLEELLHSILPHKSIIFWDEHGKTIAEKLREGL